MKLRQPVRILTCRITTLPKRLGKIFPHRIKAERIDYGRRLERIESAKAKKRQGTRTDLTSVLNDANVRTDEIVSEKLGIGSATTYRREKFIADNRDQLAPEDFADWDEGRLSTNKAYQHRIMRMEIATNRDKMSMRNCGGYIEYCTKIYNKYCE